MSETIEKWSTLKDVQEHLGVGRDTILQWISKRNMPAYKMGKLWKFKLSEVDAVHPVSSQPSSGIAAFSFPVPD